MLGPRRLVEAAEAGLEIEAERSDGRGESAGESARESGVASRGVGALLMVRVEAVSAPFSSSSSSSPKLSLPFAAGFFFFFSGGP